MRNSGLMLQTDDNGNAIQNVGNKLLAGKTTVATAGTPVLVLPVNQKSAMVVIKALAGNTGIMYIGTDEVSATNGLALAAAGEMVTLYIDNSKAPLYVDAGTGADAVTWLIIWSE